MWETFTTTACVESVPLAWSRRLLALEARPLQMAWVQQPLLIFLTVFLLTPLGTCTLAIVVTTVSARFFRLALSQRSQVAVLLAA